jgi:hypothetical protein
LERATSLRTGYWIELHEPIGFPLHRRNGPQNNELSSVNNNPSQLHFIGLLSAT